MKLRFGCVVIGFLLTLSLVQLVVAQTSAPTSAQTASALPRLVRFSGTVKDLNGTPLTGVVGITFALYPEQTGGAPLWLETQNVTADSNGHYTVLLGSTKPDGLPAELFASEQARWVGVQVSGQAEQPRVLLVSAPYALKAGDAETIGGLPPSAFVLAGPLASGSAAGSAANGTAQSGSRAASDVTTTGGTVNFLPIFSGADTIIDSAVLQTGTGTTAKVGINTTTPATTLDVNGAGTVRGTLTLPATGTATATGGKNSQGLNLVASSFSSTSSTALNQTFRWEAESAANDTTAPSGTLNLQYGLGATAPSETGLKISSKGLLTFATGQTFPGTGAGTVTSVATGLGLKGGPITTTGTLTIDTTKIPQLGAANVFTGNQTVNGTLTVQSGSSTIVASTTNASDPAVQGIGSAIGIEGNASTTNGSGVLGFGANGVYGESSLASGSGVIGVNTATTGAATGVDGATQSPTGYGVEGSNNTKTGNGAGVFGTTLSPSGYGVEGSVNAPNGAALYGVNTGTTGNAFGIFGSSASANGFGVEGTAPVGVYGVDSLGSAVGVLGQSNSGVGVQGQATTGIAVSGLSGTGNGVYGQTTAPAGYAVEGDNFATSGNATGVYGTSSSTSGYGVEGTVASPAAYGVVGFNSATTGEPAIGVFGQTASSNGVAVVGTTDGTYYFLTSGGAVGTEGSTPSSTGWGVLAINSATSGSTGAIYGQASSGSGYGVEATSPWIGVLGSGSDGYGVYGTSTEGTGTLGLVAGFSNTASSILAGSGVWGDTGGTSGDFVGSLATADSNIALYAQNNDSSGDYPTMVVANYTTATHNPVFQTSSPGTYSDTRHCTIDTSANLTCTGVVSSVIQQVDGKQTAIYAMQSAENWLEDAGSSQLTNGSARIELDPAFAQTINGGVEYHVFLTPNGDSRGLYVSQKTATSFQVHEQGGGTSSIAFDYRIMAKRKGYESVRLEDLTGRFKQRPAPSQKTRKPMPSAERKFVPRVPSLSSAVRPSAPRISTPPVQPHIAPRPIEPMQVLPKTSPLSHPAPPASQPEVTQK